MGSTPTKPTSKDVPDTVADRNGVQNDSKNETLIDNNNDAQKKEQLRRVNNNPNYQDEPSAVAVCDAVNVPDQLEVDNNSQNQTTKDTNAQSLDENIRRAEVDKGREENIDKERKRVESVKSKLNGSLAKFRKQYQDDELSLDLIDKAAHAFNTKPRKRDSSFQATLEENKSSQARTKIANVHKTKSRLIFRLSEAASSRLRHNNPNIADLSDENRAIRLAEKLSELYDNQWTDVFEATRKKVEKKVTDREIAESLRNILQFGYDQCQDVYCKQRHRLMCELSMSTEVDLQTISPAMSLRLTEFQRLVSQQSVQHAQRVVNERANHQLRKELPVKHFGVLKKHPYISYIDLCTNITWLMQIQDPPLVLDFEGSAEVVTRFRPYTMSGPVLDYILWPAMLLHAGGPLVTKGVAQFKKNSEEQANKTLENIIVHSVYSDWS